MTHTIQEWRQAHLPPSLRGTTPLVPEGTDLEVYLSAEGEHLYAIGFAGKARKPTFNYRFKSVERRDAFIQEQTVARHRVAAANAERKNERASFQHSYQVGDVLVCSWGYDQTNVDYYQIVEVRGRTVVVIQKIASRTVKPMGSMSETVEAVPGQFLRDSKPMVKRVSPGGYVTIESYAHASKWDGKPDYSSSYA